MKKINLRGISEILSEKELKNVMGGCDVWSGGGGSDNKPSPKQVACIGAKQCDGCSWDYNGVKSYGRCIYAYFGGPLYCSDASGCYP